MSGKFALIIGNTEYVDPGLAQLTAPGKDAEDFARVLRDPNLCGFDDVKVLLNQISSTVIEAIDEFFDQRKPDDLLVLFFSGHGVRDEIGSLYLAVRNTIRSRLRSTAIKSDYIREVMDHSRSRRQVLVLDCCNSGAFAQGTKAEVGGTMGMVSAFQGYGRYVLTASDATQFAWEGNKVIGETENSLFTHFLVKGLQGEADSDGDGNITVDELYDYAFEQVVRVTPKQKPNKSATKQEGEIILRQITRIEDIKPVSLPDELLDATQDSRTFVREGAVLQLEKLLKGKNLGLARSAREALERMEREDDSRRVSQAATEALISFRHAEQVALQKAQDERLARGQAEAERKKQEAERILRAQAAKQEADRQAGIKLKQEALEREGKQQAELAAVELAARRRVEPQAPEQSVETPPKPAASFSQSSLRAVVIGLIALCILGGSAWGISYLINLDATPPAPEPTESSFEAPTNTSEPVYTSPPDCTREDVFCVGVVTDVGKINDKSFNQSAWEGVEQAQAEGLADWIQYIETADAKDYHKNIATFADKGFDVIVTVGFALGEATTAAGQSYPDTKFIGVDQFQLVETPGVVGLNFPEDHAGFLVGALAAMMSNTHKIGAVCGTDIVPAVWRFGEGYKAGASYVDTSRGMTTEVFVVYHSDVGFDRTFVDPEWGAQTAIAMMDQGADVIFGCGGSTGNGAITAAAQADVYVIGVDTDQYLTLPEAAPRMLSSATKLIAPGVFDLIKLAKEGNFPTGNYFGAAGYAPFHELDSEVPADVKSLMEEISAGLLDGSIKTNVPAAKPE